MAQNPHDQNGVPFPNSSHSAWSNHDGYYGPDASHVQYSQQHAYYYTSAAQQPYHQPAFAQQMGNDNLSQHRTQYPAMQQVNVAGWPPAYNAPPTQSNTGMLAGYGPAPVPSSHSHQQHQHEEHPSARSQQHVAIAVSPEEERTPTMSRRLSVSKNQAPPRKTLSDLDRREMCKYAETHPEEKQEAIGKLFGVERSTVSKVLRRKEKYLALEDPNSPASSVEDFERMLINWCKNQHRGGRELTDELVKTQARHLFGVSKGIEGVVNVEDPSWLESVKHQATVQAMPQPRNRKSSLARKRSKPNVKNEESKTQSPHAVGRGGSRKPSQTSLSSAYNDVSPSQDNVQGSSSSLHTSPMFSSPREAESSYTTSSGAYLHGPSSDYRPRSQLASMIPSTDDVNMLGGTDPSANFGSMGHLGTPMSMVQGARLSHHQSENALGLDYRQDISPHTTPAMINHRNKHPSLKSAASVSGVMSRGSPGPTPASADEAWRHYGMFLAYLKSPSNLGQVDRQDIAELQHLVDRLWTKRGDIPAGLSSIREGESADSAMYRQSPQYPHPAPYAGASNAQGHTHLRRSKTMGGTY